MNEDLIKIGLAIVDSSNQTIIASIDADDFPNLKAMLPPREHDQLKTFYFTTNTSSRRVQQYCHNPKASIYFYDGQLFLGLMLRGIMEVLDNQLIKERIWRDGDTMYYPTGVTDPDYCVLKFTADYARLYRNFTSTDFKV